MAESLTVELRPNLGKRHSRRIRREGQVPAVLYGHGGEVFSLTVPHEQVASMLRHGSRLVELRGAVQETAFVNDMQWDVYGSDVVHLDFIRVAEGEKVELRVKIELKGEAPGAKEGGHVELVMHELEIECPVTAIPEKLIVNIKELHLEQAITAEQVALPEGASLITDADAVVVTCHRLAEEGEEGVAVGEGAEPEIIGRKAGEEAADEE